MGAWEPIISQLDALFGGEFTPGRGGGATGGWMNRKKATGWETRGALVARRIQNKWRRSRALIGYCSIDACASGLQSQCGWLGAGSSVWKQMVTSGQCIVRVKKRPGRQILHFPSPREVVTGFSQLPWCDLIPSQHWRPKLFIVHATIALSQRDMIPYCHLLRIVHLEHTLYISVCVCVLEKKSCFEFCLCFTQNVETLFSCQLCTSAKEAMFLSLFVYQQYYAKKTLSTNLHETWMEHEPRKNPGSRIFYFITSSM